MACKLRLDIPLDKINKIFPELFKKYEISGVIKYDHSDEVTDFTINKGSSDSVLTPNHVINYHTHPISAYLEAKTLWGWPSGEDIRETIKFALAGNKAHLVFTVEGLYTIQVSPCKIKKLKNDLSSIERGILVFLIEEYFKSSHNFRGQSEIKNLNINITPYSYIDFVNNFNLSNLSAKTSKIHKKDNSVKNSYGESFSRIPNNGFPELEKDYIVTVPMNDYISEEDLDQLSPLSKDGEEQSGTITKKNVTDSFKKIFDLFNANKCNALWNNQANAWFWVNFFPSNNYQNGNFGPKNIKSIQLTETPYIKIFSNQKDGCTMSQIGKIHNFKINKSTNKSVVSKNSFGNGELTPQQRFLLYNVIVQYSLMDPETLLEITNKMIHKMNIPELNITQVQNEINKLIAF